MSRLIDRLNRVSHSAPPIGFQAGKTDWSRPRLLLIANLAQANLGGMADYLAGADAGLINIDKLESGPETLEKAQQVAADIPWGARLKTVGLDEMNRMVGAGCDFVVLAVDSATTGAVREGKAGQILEVEATLGPGLLKAVDRLPVDAVLITDEAGEGGLTWRRLMDLQRCADLLAKPLLVSVSSNVAEGELKAIWAAGIDGVVVEVTTAQPKGRLWELRQVIDGMDSSSRRWTGKPSVVLPPMDSRASVAAEEPEDD